MKQNYNYDLFTKIFEQIEKEPILFNTSSWNEDVDCGTYCGTSRCVAGWACFLSELNRGKDEDPSEFYPIEGRKLLRLTESWNEVELLFFNSNDFHVYMIIKTIVSEKELENQRSITEIANSLMFPY